MNDRGVKRARFFVLRQTSMPAVLIEVGFVTGSIDAPKLRDPNWQAQMGQAIAAGNFRLHSYRTLRTFLQLPRRPLD